MANEKNENNSTTFETVDDRHVKVINQSDANDKTEVIMRVITSDDVKFLDAVKEKLAIRVSM